MDFAKTETESNHLSPLAKANKTTLIHHIYNSFFSFCEEKDDLEKTLQEIHLRNKHTTKQFVSTTFRCFLDEQRIKERKEGKGKKEKEKKKILQF